MFPDVHRDDLDANGRSPQQEDECVGTACGYDRSGGYTVGESLSRRGVSGLQMLLVKPPNLSQLSCVTLTGLGTETASHERGVGTLHLFQFTPC